MPPKLRREMGMCATTIYVQQQQSYTIRVLVVGTPGLEPLVPGATYIPGTSGRVDMLTSPVAAARYCCNGSVG